MKSIVEQSFELNIKIMKFLGLYPSGKSSILLTVRTYVLYIFVLILSATLILIKVIFEGGDDMQSLLNLMYIADTFSFIFKVLPFLRDGERIQKCINYFGHPKFAPKSVNDRKIIEECIRICRRNSMVFFIGVIVCEIVWNVPKILTKRIPLEAWLPYDPKMNVGAFYATFLYFATATLYNAFVGTTLDPLIGGLAYHATAQLKILKYKLQHLDTYAMNFGNEFSKIKFENLCGVLKDCIEDHKSILNFVDEYEECFSFPIFCQFAGSMFGVCFCCIGIMTATPGSFRFMESCVYFSVTAFQIFFYCHYGTLLSDENNGFINAIYMGCWYKYDVKIRKTLIIMMERSKRPMVVTAGKVVDVTLQTFAAVLKSSSSLIAVFNKY